MNTLSDNNKVQRKVFSASETIPAVELVFQSWKERVCRANYKLSAALTSFVLAMNYSLSRVSNCSACSMHTSHKEPLLGQDHASDVTREGSTQPRDCPTRRFQRHQTSAVSLAASACLPAPVVILTCFVDQGVTILSPLPTNLPRVPGLSHQH